MLFCSPWCCVLLLTLLSTAVKSAPAEDAECTIHADGKYYDLRPLRASNDYEISTENGHKILLNVCKPISTEMWGLKVPNAENVGGVIRKDHGDFSIGEKNTTLAMSEGNPKLVLKNGSNCKTSDAKAETEIQFQCDTTELGSGSPRLKTRWPSDNQDDLACFFLIEWKTHYACPTGERGGPWGFFAILAIFIAVLVMLYLVLGTLYNRYILNLRGFDQIPQFSLEAMKYHSREALDWFRDLMSQFYEGSQRSGWGGNVPRSWGGARGGSQVGTGGGFRRPNPELLQQRICSVNKLKSMLVQGDQKRCPMRKIRELPTRPEPLPVKKFEPAPSTADERTFMLGDTDEEDEVFGTTPITGGSNASASRSSSPYSDSDQEKTIAQLRGRDQGAEGSIRL
ncbi:hypothetical protein D9757_008549 [Collybiopsis confluens]|uniref:Autophagy-related protein 27 n=1 Tax=Collybiopsis confluens TaxID=2823264 RepID=A0A8H5LZU3_9AGAR|nr:hypothetical protein D9757_008549 [Collybiopsis confluens]